MKQVNLLTDSPRRLFFHYLGPTIGSSMVTSIYILADTIMVGQGVGDAGLAALTIFMPIVASFFALGLLLGVGGGVLMSVAKGSGNESLAHKYFSTAMISAAVVSVCFAVFGAIFFDPMMYALGADTTNIELVRGYGLCYTVSAPLFIFSSSLQSFIRNDKSPRHAMIAVLTGSGLNILLDYLFIFVFKMGMFGASFATSIGTSITVCILIIHFFTKKNTMRFSFRFFSIKALWEIAKCGFSSFLIECANAVLVFVFNHTLLKYIGSVGVTVYSIMSNVAVVCMSLFNGVTLAAQPIIATNHGADNHKRVLQVRHIGTITSSVIAVIIFCVGFFFPDLLIYSYVKDPTPEILELARYALRIYFFAYLFMNFNIFFSGYFQSTLRPVASITIQILRSLLLSSVLVSVLPMIFGADAIWYAVPITECITFFVAMAFLFFGRFQKTKDAK